MPLVVLEARMWSVSVVVGVGVQLQARTVLEIVHLDGRAGWRARELRALSSRCCRCEHLLSAKEYHDAFGRVRSTHVERFYGCGRGAVGVPLWPLGHVQCSIWCIWMGEWGGTPESFAR